MRRELSNLSVGAEFDLKKANILHKLAQTYAILDAHVDKEHKKYSFESKTDADLATLEQDALRQLGK